MEIERIRGVIAQMKLHEKLSLTGGESITAAVDRLKVPSIDLGDALEPYSVQEPSALALGCTFSAELCADLSKYRSAEAARAGKAFAGAIGAGLIRDPMRPDACEFFSEDALVAAELLKAYASGGVLGYIFTDALGQGRYENRTADSRALYELYLYPLEKAGMHAAALMTGGGYLNGNRVSSSRTVGDVFTKYIPSDAMLIAPYGSDAESCAAGSGAYVYGADASDKKAIHRAVVDGKLFENKLNINLERTVATVARTHEFYKKDFDRNAKPVDITLDSSVLLKNDGLLPVTDRQITLFGDATAFADGHKFNILPAKEANKKYGAFNVFLITDYDENGIDPAVASAVCACGAAASTVVVLCGGAACELPVADSVNAVLYCPYCPKISTVIGMLKGNAPRGHLPFTWTESRSEYPINNEKLRERGDFRYESVYNGYRLFENFTSVVRYPFGHGLDYTSYEISKFSASSDKLTVTADFVIKNVGSHTGTALCQVYISPLSGSVYGLTKRLAAFKRVPLEPTENSRVKLTIDLNDFAVYDENNRAFQPVGGRYRIDVGLSVRDIRASGEVKVAAGSRVNSGLSEKLAPSYYRTDAPFSPTAPEIERLLKVPFIKKPDEYEDIQPPEPNKVKHLIKRAEKSVSKRLFPRVKYAIETTPKTK